MELNHLQRKGITPIGVTNHRDERIPFGIKDADRFGHIYAIGKTGMGKSTLLYNMAKSDIERGLGMSVLDPHGDVALKLLKLASEVRKDDLVYLSPGDPNCTVKFNPLNGVSPSDYHLVASGLITSFKKIWHESWGPRMEHILRFTILSLLEYPFATLLDIQPLLTDPAFRKHVVSFVSNQATKDFWQNEFEKYSPNLKSEAVSPIINKTSLFRTSEPLKRIVGSIQGNLNIQEVMDNRKVLIVNLSKGTIGEDASTLLGSILVTAFQLGAMNRSTIQENQRVPFFLYVDEAHNFISQSFADILSEARKYKLSLFITHQYIEQLSDKVRQAIFGNVGTIICFRVGVTDAEFLLKEFNPEFNVEDLVSLPKLYNYIKLMIGGICSRPFSALLEK